MMIGAKEKEQTTDIVIDVTIMSGRALLISDVDFILNGKDTLNFKPYVKLYFRDKKYGSTQVIEKSFLPHGTASS